MSSILNDSTMLVTLSVGELRGLITEILETKTAPEEVVEVMDFTTHWGKGIKSVMKRYSIGCEKATQWVNGFLSPAVRREGRNYFINFQIADQIILGEERGSTPN